MTYTPYTLMTELKPLSPVSTYSYCQDITSSSLQHKLEQGCFYTKFLEQLSRGLTIRAKFSFYLK